MKLQGSTWGEKPLPQLSVSGEPLPQLVITRRDEVRGELGGVRAEDLLVAAREFEVIWQWPAPGTRFPPQQSPDDVPNPRFAVLGERLTQSHPEGDLEFRGFLDHIEETRLAAGAEVRVERTALERHLCALDYGLKGRLGLVDLYHAFIASRLPLIAAAKKALGALLFFGRGRPVEIAKIAERRPAARSGGFDARGEVDPEIIGQYRCLFDTTSHDEVEQSRLASFNKYNFQGGKVSNQQWETFFATCKTLNHRETVTFKQLRGMFDGTFGYIAPSIPDAAGRRPLDRVVPPTTIDLAARMDSLTNREDSRSERRK